MSLSEIPSKIIEKAEALTEKKLEIAALLTALIYYSSKKEDVTEETVLQTYFKVFNDLKQLAPPPLEKIYKSRKHTYINILISILGGIGFIYLLYRIGVLQKIINLFYDIP
jgi:hypothetical protein